jgi:diguanylate cyclase (GGDEF)-like protein
VDDEDNTLVTAPEPEGSQGGAGHQAALSDLRGRVMWGMVLLFVLVMTVVTILVWTAGGDGAQSQLSLRLALLGVVLPVAMAAVARRILAPTSELESMTDQLRTRYSQARLDALLDPITGLGNHRAFQEELHRQIEDAQRQGHPLALAIIDLDELKHVNDEHGHAIGDQLLGSMGRLLVSASRAADRGFRIGGDEFALLLPHSDAASAHAVVRRMLASALSAETTFNRPFSFSGGVSAYPEPSRDGRRLLRNADAALYWAKRHGRTDVQLFDPARHGVSDDQRSTPELIEALDRVTAEGAITAVFQPIFDLVSGQPVGFEGLVRPTEVAAFRDATALFTAAEVADRTVELDMIAIRTIASSLKDNLQDRYLSVNISPRSMETNQFQVAELVAVLSSCGLSPDRVIVELTEREAIADMDRLRTNLQACQAAGFRIAADDVGAGNAGLRLLSEVRFDIVKIDLSLVQGGVLRDSALAVLRAIQDLAAQSNARVVAEGIETVEQLVVVRRLGISSGQGFLLASPAPEARAEAFDIGRFIASHEARRQALLGGWDSALTT